MIKKALFALIVAGPGLFMSACADPKIYIEGGSKLNPNAGKVATPVRVRIYFLRDNGEFDRAGFGAVWGGAKAALGDDLLGDPVARDVIAGKKEEIVLTKEILPSATGYIGVAGNFTPPGGGAPDGSWKLSIPLGDIDKNVVFLNDHNITLKKR